MSRKRSSVPRLIICISLKELCHPKGLAPLFDDFFMSVSIINQSANHERQLIAQRDAIHYSSEEKL